MFKPVEKKSQHRLLDWLNFRKQLDNSPTPLDDVDIYFKKVPRVKVYTDPYDQSTWPTAWELIDENEYCPFNLILAVCYTLQLTSQFKDAVPAITITVDNVTKTVYYLLFVNDSVYGYDETGWIPAKNLPNTLKNLKIYEMPRLH
jgi:hypothetical protein